MRLSLEVGYDIKFGLVGVAVYLFIVFFIKRYYDIELYILKKDRCQPEQYTLLFQGFPKSKTDQLKMWIEK